MRTTWCFPAAGFLDKSQGTIRFDYRVADTGVALATALLDDVLKYLRDCPAPQRGSAARA
jgi:predicted GH43/DUF377 family glycosyl hydrolase